MTWAKLDDKILMHPKMRKARRLGGDTAFAAWAGALAYTSQFDLDGFVPADIVPDLCSAPKKAIEALVSSGLWEKTEGGFQIHDWAELNLTREERDAKREAGNDRLKRSRESKREKARSKTKGETQVTRVSSANDTPSDTGMSSTETATDPIRSDPIQAEAEVTRGTAAGSDCGLATFAAPPVAKPLSPEGEAILARMKTHPELAPIATAGHADRLAVLLMSGKKLDWILTAVDELADKAAGAALINTPWTAEFMGGKAMAFGRNAAAPRVTPGQGQAATGAPGTPGGRGSGHAPGSAYEPRSGFSATPSEEEIWGPGGRPKEAGR